MKRYVIGDILILLDDNEIHFNENGKIGEFECTEAKDSGIEKILYKAEQDNLHKYDNGELIQKNGLMELFKIQDKKLLVNHWRNHRWALVTFIDELEKDDQVLCYVDKDLNDSELMSITRFLTSAGLHSKLLQKGALVFHSAYIDWNGQAILFAGPSGVGKSTQAALWEQYAGAEIINGDRTLLRRKDDVWHAYGYPCCGSSDICKNRTLPLKAIVILEKGDKNEVQELTMGQKYRALFTGSEMYLWYEKEMERVSRLAEDIMKEVRIIKLICRPDADAVKVLKEALEENNEQSI